MDVLLFVTAKILIRYGDAGGHYVEPPGVGDGGDATGLINAAQDQVLQPLREALDRARADLRQVADEIDDHRRRVVGPGYHPLPRDENGRP